MRFLLLTISSLVLGCNQFSSKKIPVRNKILIDSSAIIDAKFEIPEGAIMADFFGNKDSLYANIAMVNVEKQTTQIVFENNRLPNIIIPESIGAELNILKLKNFKKDVLLVNATLKDSSFIEYYLFVWNDSVWQQPVNRFAIHKSNLIDSLMVITNNPKDSTQLLRYYSVFNMDRKSDNKFTWKLMQESVPVIK